MNDALKLRLFYWISSSNIIVYNHFLFLSLAIILAFLIWFEYATCFYYSVIREISEWRFEVIEPERSLFWDFISLSLLTLLAFNDAFIFTISSMISESFRLVFGLCSSREFVFVTLFWFYADLLQTYFCFLGYLNQCFSISLLKFYSELLYSTSASSISPQFFVTAKSTSIFLPSNWLF